MVSIGVGLAGTILGVLRGFCAVAWADSARKSALLTEGISDAVNATFFGFGGAAVPFLIALVLLLRRQPCADG